MPHTDHTGRACPYGTHSGGPDRKKELFMEWRIILANLYKKYHEKNMMKDSVFKVFQNL